MVFKTCFSKDILNTIFEYADIIPQYDCYKRQSLSVIGYKNIKMSYNCNCCNKKIRNPKLHASYGFILQFYKYYDVKMTNCCYKPNDITRFYHPKRQPDEILYNILRNVQGDVTEGPYNFSIQMANTVDDKVLGKLIINTLSYLGNRINQFNKEKRRLEKCGVKIYTKMDSKNKITSKIKKSILDLNENDVKVGYYCKNCCNNKKYYKFVKL